MTETEWRNLGVQQSPGWVNYMIHSPGKGFFFCFFFKKIQLTGYAYGNDWLHIQQLALKKLITLLVIGIMWSYCKLHLQSLMSKII